MAIDTRKRAAVEMAENTKTTTQRSNRPKTKNETESSNPPRPRGRPSTSSRISVGTHGEAALELMYRLGGVTAPQLGAFIGISDAAASRTLKTLERSRLAEQNAVKAWWHPANGRPRSFYYLSSRDGGRGIVYGAYLAGEEDERKARASYKLCQLPARAAHASLRNEYYLMLREDAADRTRDPEESDVSVPAQELWAESHEDFAYLDEGTIKGDRANARRKHGRVYPDGYFSVRFGEGENVLRCRYLVEVETQARARKLLQKLDGYGSYFARRLKEDPERMSGWLYPLIFLFRQNSTAASAANTVAGAVRADAPELRRYLAWSHKARNRGVEAGRLILFASLEDLEKHGSLATRYGPLVKYPAGEGVGSDGRVDLEAVAEEVDMVVSREKRS